MGRKQARLSVHGSLSAHNDDQDELDREAWARFVSAVRELASRAEFAEINLFVVSDLD